MTHQSSGVSLWRSGRATATIAVIAATSVLVACSSSSKPDAAGSHSASAVAGKTSASASIPHVAAVTALHDLLPSDIKSSGVLTVAIDPSAAPIEYLSSSQEIVGVDPDFMAAITDVLGVKLKFVDIKFDGILASLQAHRADMAASDFSLTAERSKVVDFVSYMNAASTVLVKKGNPEKLTAILDLCGKTVSVLTASSQAEVDLPAISAQCKAGHKPTVKVLAVPSEQNAIQAVATGRVDAEIDDSAVAGYQATLQPGVLETVPSMPFKKSPVGMPFPKGSRQLENAIVAALNHLISDGTYGRILAKWGAQPAAIAKAELKVSGSV